MPESQDGNQRSSFMGIPVNFRACQALRGARLHSGMADVRILCLQPQLSLLPRVALRPRRPLVRDVGVAAGRVLDAPPVGQLCYLNQQHPG